MGIPGTLVAGPLVSVAIPGLLLILIVGPVSEGAASFLAGGTDLVLALLIRVVEALATPSWAALFAARHLALSAGALAAVLLLSLGRVIGERGTVAIEVLDVGQGDAVLIR